MDNQLRVSKQGMFGIAAVLAMLLIVDLLDGSVGRDFAAYFHAGTVVVDGGDLYAAFDFPFVYLPPFALAFMPFALIGYTAAAAVWTIACWVAAIAGCIAWGRAVRAPVPAALLACCAVLFHPAYVALEALNAESIMFLLLALCSPLTARGSGSRRELLGGLLLGVGLMMKPYYLPIAWMMTLLQQRVWMAVGLALGAVIVLGCSMADATLWANFLSNAGSSDAWRFDAWLLPAVGVVLTAVWMLGAVVVWRRGDDDAWVYALTLGLLWPRMLMYSYLICLPLVLFLSTRGATKRALVGLFVLFSTPVGLALAIDRVDGELVLRVGGLGYLVTTALYWGALLLLSVATWRAVSRPKELASD